MSGRTKPFPVVAIVGAGLIAIGLMVGGTYQIMGRAWVERSIALALVGSPEAMVYAKLGAPEHIVEAKHEGGVEAVLVGTYESMPERPVGDKVLIYLEGRQAVFVYIDAQAKVEAAHVATRSARPESPSER